MNHERLNIRPGPAARLLRLSALLPVLLGLGLLTACADMVTTGTSPMRDMPAAGGMAAPSPAADVAPSGTTVAFTLKTAAHGGGLVFICVGGDIEGVMNPALRVGVGDRVEVTLINEEPSEHDIAFPDQNAQSARVRGLGAQTTVAFTATQAGTFAYSSTLPAPGLWGLDGLFGGGGGAAAPLPTGVSIVRAPTDLPPPLGHRPPQIVRVSLEAVEVEGRLAEGATYTYWTYNGQVPGPFLRVRVGDTVDVGLKNRADSHMTHSIDLHAVTGPDGGAAVMQVPPGQEKHVTFKALHPGLYVYHCATPMVAQHIASGMYGLILVEPEGGLPPVDREFYVTQNEIYTEQPFGATGHLLPSETKLLAEQPEYFVFNGAVGALKTEQPLRARTGETVRIFFGVGGPNLPSSFHVIGEIFDRVYNQGSLTSPPLTDVQSTLVPVGGSTVVEFTVEVPGMYMLVDHSLSRVERGLSGALIVEGAPRPDLFHEGPADAGGDH
jgi:nitrite reductase (NO-forming)